MSDLYHVSLDHLLKGDKPDYLDYLSESTDTVQSRRKQSFMALMLVYLGIWAFSLIVFWFFSSGSDAMGRSEEHTSELQSRFDLVCRLLLEKKKQFDDTIGWLEVTVSCEE